MVFAERSRELGRNDRHVLRARLRTPAGAPARLLASRAEEALRLCSLPGEFSGRAYHFRRLQLAGLPENGDRSVWLEAFQRELTQLARRAVHGTDWRAASADAVFFHSRAEACGSLLALLVRQQSADAWFWPAVSASPPGAPAADRLVNLIEILRASPASWSAVAATIFELLEADDTVPLLHLLPDSAAARWVHELGGDRVPWRFVLASEQSALARSPVKPDRDAADVPWRVSPAVEFPASTQTVPARAATALGSNDNRVLWLASLAVKFPASTQTVLARAAAALGWNDNRVLWLASLAVVLACPSDLEKGAVVARALASLSALASTAPRPRPARRGPQTQRQADSAPGAETVDEGAPKLSVTDPIYARQAPSAEHANSVRTPTTIRSDPVIDRRVWASQPGRCFGEPTQGAGLYFLLNALGRLRSDDDPFSPWFLAHFFLHVARHAVIEIDDPILLWARDVLDQPDPRTIDQRLVRIWAIKVRRWCWRNARIGVREIVRRPGWVTLTRTDLDVPLALDLADVRIRRVGLDLDPGWIPWFGRVVRFHYLTGADHA